MKKPKKNKSQTLDPEPPVEGTIESELARRSAAASAAAAPAPRKKPSAAPADLKESKASQREYGRRSQLATQHFETSDRRLKQGNPDVGEIDLGNIEADRPAEPDDHDHYD